MTTPLHAGLNLVFLVPGETGGMETYARELVAALREQEGLRLTVFLSREAATEPGPWSELDCVTVPVRARRRVEWVRGEQLLLPRLAARTGVDLLHSLASTAPARGPYRRVVTVHDLIYRRYPEAHQGLRAKGIGLLVPLAVRRSNRVIAPSTATRDDLVSLLHVSPAKIDVVPEGVRPPPARPRGPAPGERPVVLSVAARRPHKNLARLLEALALIPAKRRPALVLPGYATPWDGELRRDAAALGVEEDVRFLGWVSEAELEDLYATATLFVLPSLYEGFGLPVLEAMARGLPVACSDRGSLPEVAGGAARLFDPERPETLATAIAELLADPAARDRLAAAGRRQAERFTWRDTGRLTAAVYRRALSS